ncbi:hypothetical protein [Pseudoponticoccus marisrubri]|uniref:Uncharacterized protein n=1 Tax=Pseudoponticoccus marisrubri TaxID=1685382 RepID=A0A0W7WHF3_9RHOB|nr:hypothetical protein [Pseudoponticoccus marisrubri]KUF10044.1 hypothetical protein AVJ23_14985 [Pseudoponticoccus marisrubri]
MSNRLSEEELRARFNAAKSKIEREKQARTGETAALMLAVAAFDEERRKPRAQKAVHVAQLLCIAFAFITPNVLMMVYAF